MKIEITKTCPECGRALVIRTNRLTGIEFLGCIFWPECKHTEPIPESLRMRLAGAPSLFDDEETNG